MTLPFNHADSIREYLTGAASDGASQDQPNFSLGSFRSATEAFIYGIQITNPLQGVIVQMASGGNSPGIGSLSSPDGVSLFWGSPTGYTTPPNPQGLPCVFTLGETQTLIVEGSNQAAFLRIVGTPPFTVDTSTITLSVLLGNVFGLSIVPDASAASGIDQYRGTILRNESQADVSLFYRWISELAPSSTSDQHQLGASGAGTIQTSGQSLMLWPSSGWCQVRSSGGSLKETVYYSSRTSYALSVPSTGRGVLGTTATAGSATDTIHAVPGIAVALDTNGIQPFGSAMAVIANENIAPAGVVWNQEIAELNGLSVPRLAPGEQIGLWIWRQMPAGVVFSPNVYNGLNTTFLAY